MRRVPALVQSPGTTCCGQGWVVSRAGVGRARVGVSARARVGMLDRLVPTNRSRTNQVAGGGRAARGPLPVPGRPHTPPPTPPVCSRTIHPQPPASAPRPPARRRLVLPVRRRPGTLPLRHVPGVQRPALPEAHRGEGVGWWGNGGGGRQGGNAPPPARPAPARPPATPPAPPPFPSPPTHPHPFAPSPSH